MRNKTPILYQLMLVAAFSCLTLYANAQNAYEAEQRARAADEAASKAQFDRNKAISTGRGAPNPLQGVVDEQERQQIARKEKEREEYQKEKAEEARKLAIWKTEYAKNAGQRAIDARVSANKRDREDAFTIFFKNTGLVEYEAGCFARSSESAEKLQEISPQMEYLKTNIASADFEVLDIALRQLIVSGAELTALKYIYKLDRFTTKEAEIDALKVNALLMVFKRGSGLGSYYGKANYDINTPIYEGDDLKLLQLYFMLEDKYPDVNLKMNKANNYNYYSSPYDRINTYYAKYGMGWQNKAESNGKILRTAKKLRLEYVARGKQKAIEFDEKTQTIAFVEQTHTMEGIKELARIRKVKPSDIEQKQFRAIDFAIYMQLAAEGDDDALVKAYSLWQKMNNDNYKYKNLWKFNEMQRFTYDKWVDYLVAKSKKDNGAAAVMKIIYSDQNFTNGVLRDSNYKRIQALVQQYSNGK